MGFFSDLWDFIKSCARSIYNFFSKVFSIIFKGVRFIVECVIQKLVTIKNSWIGMLFEGVSFIFDLLDFFKSKGADVDVDGYKRELLDMNLKEYGMHRYDIIME